MTSQFFRRLMCWHVWFARLREGSSSVYVEHCCKCGHRRERFYG